MFQELFLFVLANLQDYKTKNKQTKKHFEKSSGAIWSKRCWSCHWTLPENIPWGEQWDTHTHTVWAQLPLAHHWYVPFLNLPALSSSSVLHSLLHLCLSLARLRLPLPPSRHTHTSSSSSSFLSLISQGSTPACLPLLLTAYFAWGPFPSSHLSPLHFFPFFLPSGPLLSPPLCREVSQPLFSLSFIHLPFPADFLPFQICLSKKGLLSYWIWKVGVPPWPEGVCCLEH